MITNTIKQTVRSILSERDDGEKYIYRIPPYQRGYEWGSEQWDNLFDDIVENEKEYFLGSIICIVDGEGVDDYRIAQVIDGQQRLTTLNILLLEIYSALDDRINNSECMRVYNSNKEYRRAFLNLEDFFVAENSKKSYRFEPSIQGGNKDDYNYLLQQKINPESNPQKPAYYGNRRISKCAHHFRDRINKYIQEKAKDYGETNKDKNIEINKMELLFELLAKVTSALVVRIDTEDAQSAFILFESVNNRGIPLSAIDLIKNTLISQMDDPEKTNTEWQLIINNLADPGTQTRFLRHFVYAFSHDKKIKVNSRVTKSNLIKIYTGIIKGDSKYILGKLIEESKNYRMIALPYFMQEDEVWKKYQNNLVNLEKLGVSSAYILLLFLSSKYPHENISPLLEYLEKWFIVRHLTNTPASNTLDRIFSELVETQMEKYNFNIIKRELSEKMPSKVVVEEKLRDNNLYGNANLCKSLLVNIEQSLRTKENDVNFWETKNNRPVWTIEHIYPQDPKDLQMWSKNSKEFLHKLGNLTLTAYNAGLSNRSFDEKAGYADKDDKPIGLKSGVVKINDYLIDKEEWSDEDIVERGQKLEEMFLKNLYG